MLATVASYESNGLHWRTLRDNGVYERDLFYYSSDWQLLEEHRIAHEGNPATGSLVRVAQQFWGLRYIDDAVARRVDANADGDYIDDTTQDPPVEGEGTWFYVTDVQFSVVALLDDIAVLSERVRYDAYGRARHRWPTDLDGDGDADNDDYFDQLGAASTTIHGTNYNPDADHDRDGDVDNNDFFAFLGGARKAALTYGLISDSTGGSPDSPIGYDGYVFAPEAGIVVGTGGGQAQAVGAYCVRFRWYVPETGRWLQRDPAGYVDGANSYGYVNSAPQQLDPLGLWGGAISYANMLRGIDPAECLASAFEDSVSALEKLANIEMSLAQNGCGAGGLGFPDGLIEELIKLGIVTPGDAMQILADEARLNAWRQRHDAYYRGVGRHMGRLSRAMARGNAALQILLIAWDLGKIQYKLQVTGDYYGAAGDAAGLAGGLAAGGAAAMAGAKAGVVCGGVAGAAVGAAYGFVFVAGQWAAEEYMTAPIEGAANYEAARHCMWLRQQKNQQLRNLQDAASRAEFCGRLLCCDENSNSDSE